jgi:GGDEF domain-containing protein
VTEGLELLLELSGGESDIAAIARELLEEAEPIVRTDLATFIRATHSWNDTFALYCLSCAPRTLERMRPFAIAIAACYAPAAKKSGVVRGMRFPFHDKPLVSASAMLASGCFALASDIALTGLLAERIALAQYDDGGFADDEHPDLLTTYLAAQLLARIEPSFDPTSAARFLVSRQLPDGSFRALGPETPWLTARIAEFLRSVSQPFSSRFEWPRYPDANRDSKTGLAPYAHFVEIAELFASIRGLAGAACKVCFLDLAGFRAFNNAYGQARGDAVLAAFARELGSIDECVAIRDGGDEFLLVGAPTGRTLGSAIEALRDRWPGRFVELFGEDAKPVVARFLVAEVAGNGLRNAREELGRMVGELKHIDASNEPRGIRHDAGRLQPPQ